MPNIPELGQMAIVGNVVVYGPTRRTVFAINLWVNAQLDLGGGRKDVKLHNVESI